MEQKDSGHVGERIKKVRKKLAISQKDFAEKTNISSSFLSEVEAGKTKPGYDFFYNATHKLKVNPLYLLTGKGDMFLRGEPGDLAIPDGYFGPQTEAVSEMLHYIKHSILVRYTMLTHFRHYLLEHGQTIEKDMESNEKGEEQI